MGMFLFTIVISAFGSFVLLAAISGRVSQQCRRAVDHVAVVKEAEAIRAARQVQIAGLAPLARFRGDAVAGTRGESR